MYVTVDLEREHTLDADQRGDCLVEVWWCSSYLPARKCNFRDITKVPVSRDL